MNEQTSKEFAIYKGDSFICLGKFEECAEFIGIKPRTLHYYTLPSYQNRKRKNPDKRWFIVELDDDEE